MTLRAQRWLVVTLFAMVAAAAQGSSGGAFGPLLVSSNPPGNNSGPGQILAFDPVRGGSLGTFASGGGLSQAQGLALGHDGNLYVASGATNVVLKYSGVTGAFLGNFASIQSPVGIIFGPDGDLYVVSNNPDSVVRFDGTTGASLGTFVAASSTNNLNTPFALAFGPDNNLYVTSTLSGSVLRFDGTTGDFMNVFASLPTGAGPTGLLFVPNGDLLVSDVFNSQILRFDSSTGAAKGVFASGKPLNGPSSLVSGPSGDIYVANAFAYNVLRYNYTTGNLLDIFLPTSSSGPGAANFLVFAPPFPQPAISRNGSSNGIVNAASYVGGKIAPGEMLTIFGTNMGPTSLASLQVDPSTGYVSNYTAGTRVLFNGTPGAMIYSRENQVSVVAPYEIAQDTQVNVQVEYLGQFSTAIGVNAAPSLPGIFSVTADGKGQAAIINSDGVTPNSSKAPARKGSAISIYATGAGQTNPPGIDGQLSPATPPLPIVPVSVTIGGEAAKVLYAGGSPGEILSILQVNVIVPDSAPSGSQVPVTLNVGNAQSQAGITMAIQ